MVLKRSLPLQCVVFHHSALTDIDLEECNEEVEGGRPPLSTGKVLEDGPEHDVHVLRGAAKSLDACEAEETILRESECL